MVADSPESWLIEAVKVNNGYGLPRLLARFQEKFPDVKDEWSLQYLVRFLTSVDHRNESTLYDDIQVSDSGRKSDFHDPDEYDDKSNLIISPKTKPSSNKLAHMKSRKAAKEITPEGSIGSDIPAELEHPKHKVAWKLLSENGDDSLDYYSPGGTVTKRYWLALASKLSVDLPKTVRKQEIPKHIFDQCKVTPPFEDSIHLGGQQGAGIRKTAFVDLCDFLNIELPADLVTEIDEHEDDLRIDISKPLDPVLTTESLTIGDLIEEYTGGLIFTPEFQRGFRWSITKQRELIESVLIGIPLPTILLIREQDGDWWLVDGRQRVTTLRRFIDPENRRSTFHLGILGGENARYSNFEFTGLPSTVRERILKTLIPVTRIEGLQENRAAVYELFRRYNTGGTNLNGAEIRHAVFHENPSHMALFKLAGEDRDADEYTPEIKRIRKLLRISNKGAKGFATYDKICRYFGYRYSTKGMTTSTAIHSFFQNYGTSERASELAQEFKDTAEFCHDLFGRDHRFARLREDGTPQGFAAWAYTIQMVGCRHILDQHPDKKSQILDKEGAVIPLWDTFYMEHVFNHRQNSTTLWGSQEVWVGMLEQWIHDKFSDSEKELAVRQLRDMDQRLRRAALNKLKSKEYYREMVKIAEFEGWI